MINIAKYRLAYLIMLILSVIATLFVSIFALGMKEHESTPWGIFVFWGFSVFQMVTLSLPLFKRIRENRKYRFLFGVNLLILLFYAYEVIEYALTSDFDTMKGIIYVLFLFLISDLFLGNFKLIKNKF